MSDGETGSIFTLDFGSNGGVFAPTSITDILEWLSVELNAWNWITQISAGTHRDILTPAISQLRSAQTYAQQASERINEPDIVKNRLNAIREHLSNWYSLKFPHSTSSLGMRALEIRKRSPEESIAYLYAYTDGTGYVFAPTNLYAWRGLITGVLERFGTEGITSERLQSIVESSDSLRAKLERTLNSKTKAIAKAEERFELTVAEVLEQKANQGTEFRKFVDASATEHKDMVGSHKVALGDIENTFRKAMALRAPVEYWEAQRKIHEDASKDFAKYIGMGIFLFAVVLAMLISWALWGLQPKEVPQAWKLGVLGLAGAVSFWVLRLVVRLFLSHRHLENDAAERITMIKTYLALGEEGRTSSEDERKLVMGALFRTASDGIVKDDAVLNPVLEAFTRPK